MLNRTRCEGISEQYLEWERNLQLSRTHILRYRAGTPDQHRQNNGLHRQTRIGAAQRQLSPIDGERFMAPGHARVPRAE